MNRTNHRRSQTLRTVLDTYLAPISPSDSNDASNVESSTSKAKSRSPSKDIKASNAAGKKASSPSSQIQSSSSSSTKKTTISKPAAPNHSQDGAPSLYNSTSPPLLSTPPNADDAGSPSNVPAAKAGPTAGPSNTALPNATPNVLPIGPPDNATSKGKADDDSSTKAENPLRNDRTDNVDPSVRPLPTRQQTVLRARDHSAEQQSAEKD